MTNKLLNSRQDIWKREFEFSKNPRFWKSFAVELYSCARLLEKNWEFFNKEENIKGGIQESFFFAPKFIRLFWGYALENLMKGILLANDSEEKYVNKSGHISWGKNGHNLVWLKNELKYIPKLPKEWDKLPDKYINVDFYLNVWETSVLWYGKYPFPTGMNAVLDEYKSLSSNDALIKRRLNGKRKMTINDLLHTDINRFEKEIFEIIYRDLCLIIEKIEKKNNIT